MKAFFIPTLLASTMCMVMACQAQDTRNYDLEDFSEVYIKGPYSVTMRQGNDLKVSLSGDEDIIENTTVKISGDRLYIEMESSSWWKSNSGRVEVELTFNELSSLFAGGASNVDVRDKVISDDFELEVTGASELYIMLETDDMEIDLTGASELDISGFAGVANIDISGASDLNAEDFMVTDCEIEASGASGASIGVKERLNADASGASSIRYYGNPKYVNTDASGASSISARN